MTDVWDAVNNGTLSDLDDAIEKRFDVNVRKTNTPNTYRLTPIQILVEKALENGLSSNPNKYEQQMQISMMKRLLKQNADINIGDRNNNPPLIALVRGRFPNTPDRPHRFRMIAPLLHAFTDKDENGKCRDPTDQLSMTMGMAATMDWTTLIKMLLACGVDVDERPNLNETPLIIAAGLNNLRAARTLINNGANIRARTTYGMTALKLAKNRGHTEMVTYLQRIIAEQRQARDIVLEELREERRIARIHPLAIGCFKPGEYEGVNRGRLSCLNPDAFKEVLKQLLHVDT
jgi:ankyrin repeat protein